MLAADFMERLAATRNDCSAFSELVFGTPLHAGQKRYTVEATADVNFLLPGNSFGKTELLLRFMLWSAWFKKGPHEPTNFTDWITQEWKGLIASYSYGIAGESFDRFLLYYRNREELKVLVKGCWKDEPSRVELNNGAIIDWGSLDGQGKLVEAARRRLICVDEAGHIPDLQGTFDSILFPRTMGVGGRIHLFGTPKPHSDPYLLEVYEKGRDGADPFYHSQDGSVLENEFWPEEERKRVFANPRYVTGWVDCPEGGCSLLHCWDAKHPEMTQVGKQVILGAFTHAGGLFFKRTHTQRIFTGDHEVEWVGTDKFMSEVQAGHIYLGAFDLGGNKRAKRSGKGGSDATVGFVIDYTRRPWSIVHYEYVEGGDADWQDKYDLMEAVYRRYSMPYLIIDATGTIDSVQEELISRGVEVEGIHFGGSSGKKFDMLRNLQLVTELDWEGQRGLLRSPAIPRLKWELDHYVLPDDTIKQDHVMTLAMLCHHIAQVELPEASYGEVY